ncbi:H/ACA ribonucleoprotein complex subunit GAR1 [Halobacterium sp. CBA1126]|uniref:H/ACA ribonucleoprotein complex subunit GAR1 n=1 Tax=Halobacterium TaxID=2239 RepID=UPI0012FB04E3|nr:Gar1/Naf1 family protein [Halobacterium sp. CBA1126]MUV60530.1 H/ACA RNA-protein complex protein Gar1 [Halobacterium sp. CBA1126]
MERAGDVVRTAQNVAVVRCEGGDHPDIGAVVVDQNLDEVGRVVDVFGPVERPYLSVTPDEGVHLPALVGQTLYVR